MTAKEKIYRCLIGAGLTAAGAAGLMGNLYAESGLKPKNLENKYEKSLGYTDASYTEAVDSGEYKLPADMDVVDASGSDSFTQTVPAST